ncbi:MAG TPA: VWA domain-containing protein [Candidatus Ozemobacteraceae bacterium]|nr:VWA domain-containing protein [Candidatus Ozemobacteraceae bacterium]
MRKITVSVILFIFAFASGLAAAAITPEQPMPFKIDKDNETISFTFDHPGNRQLAIAVDFTGGQTASGAVKITGEATVKAGLAEWKAVIDRQVFAHDGATSVVDGLKPLPGKWQLQLTGTEIPVSGQLRLIDLGEIPVIQYSEQTGAVQIKKPGNQNLIACAEVDHPDFSGSDNEFSGSVTAEGDVMIPLPPGFYRLQHPADTVSSLQAHMIPVQPGKITIVENWPQAPASEAPADNEAVTGIATPSSILHREMRIRSARLLNDDQVQIRFATPQWPGQVRKEDLEASESGVKAEVISAGTVATPLSLTILLDSSGSMKKDMKLALDSVDQFIRLLPPDSEIALVDFDTKAKEIAAKDRTALLKALKSIKADGATCLNDSVMLGLSRCKDRSRPAVLLFTDGFDANHNDTGPGSKTRPEEMFAAVKEAEIPVFTIGFGAKPDDVTLKRLATLSGGFYHKADKDNISKVFAQVASILGREHEMVYRRPGVRGNADAPVISIVLDVSGSMNMPPEEEGCDYRLEKAKAILRDLIRQLPEDAITQITTYSLYQNVVQVFTGDRAQLLASLAPIEAGGGTATFETLQTAFKMLKEIPTDRKYLLLITDAGLDLGGNEVEYQALLGSIKDAGINTTLIGMVDEREKEPFETAASMCNGQAAVSTDLNAVKTAIEAFGKRIDIASATADPRLPVQLVFSRREGNGQTLLMSGSDKFAMPLPPVTSKAAVNGLKISFAELPASLQRYNLDLSQNLYGNSKTRDETIITSRLPIDAESQNQAMRLKVIELLLLSKFRGVSVPCAAFRIRLENTLPEQETTVDSGSQAHPANFVGQTPKPVKTVKTRQPYVIPDVRSHFFARLNELPAAPISDLSWLSEDPLLLPDDESLQINPAEPVEGYLIFEFDTNETLKKAALSYYDTNFGPIHLPVIGTFAAVASETQNAGLPQKPAATIADTFKLTLNGFDDSPLPEPAQHLTLRTFSLQMTSQSQSLLDLNPVERLSLILPTRFGELVLAPSSRTTTVPNGWHKPVLFLPGSNNHLKQAYVLPATLAKQVKGSLRLDLAGNEQLLAAGDKAVSREKPVQTAAGDKISLDINAYSLSDGVALFDITLNDEKDGSGTEISAEELLQLHFGETICRYEADNKEYLFGPGDQIVVADGHSSRLIYRINYVEDNEEQPLIKSGLFKLDYQAKIKGEGKIDDYLLAGSDVFQIDPQRRNEIAALTEKVHAERVARGWKKKAGAASERHQIATDTKNTVNAGNTSAAVEIDGPVLPVPDFKIAMSDNLQALLKMNETEFIARMRQFGCIPADTNLSRPVYSPEAVLMQNWGVPADLLEIARLYYKANGAIIDDKPMAAVLTDSGKAALHKLTGWQSEVEALPVLPVGQKRLVIPFFKDAAELNDEIEAIRDEESSESTLSVSLNISLKVKPRNAGHAGMMGAMGSALGGESDDESESLLTLFDNPGLKPADCSAGPIDVFYYSPDNGQTLYVSAETPAGRLENQAQPVSLAENEVVEEIVEIRYDDEILTFRRPVASEASIVDTFRSIALCQPDITASASEELARQFAAKKSEAAPGTRSAIRWFTHSRIFQFLALHSAAEAEAAAITGVKAARPAKRMRAIILTLTGEKNGIRALFDLRQINPVVQGDEKAVRAFNFFMGITNTMLEEQVMGGGGLLSRWKMAKDPKIVIAGPEEVGTLIESLDEKLVSESTFGLLQKAADEGKGVIMALNAPIVADRAMPAWFTFDPATYEMMSVLDNGAHGSLVERPINEIIQDASKYSIGFWVGVNASVWAVSAYKLKYADMRTVVKAAKKLCLDIAAQLENIGKPLNEFIPDSYTMHEAELSAGPASLKVGFGEFTPGQFKLMTKPSLGFNLSYQSGFEDAVKAFFRD